MDRQPDLLAALEQAWARMVLVLFESFDMTKWLLLAFCAWLMNLVSSGSQFNCHAFSNACAVPPIPGLPQVPGPVPPGPGFPTPTPGAGTEQLPGAGAGAGPTVPAPSAASSELEAFEQWITGADPVLVLLAVAAVLLGLAIAAGFYILLKWLSARGRFMLVDGIVKNRGAVAEPWTEYGREANSLTLLEVSLGFAVGAVVLLVGLAATVLAWPDIAAQQFTTWTSLAIGLSVLVIAPTLFVWAVLATTIDHFVLPVMYARRISAPAACREVWSRLIKAQLGVVVLYFLLLIVLNVGIAMLATAVSCVMCCIMWIPFVGTVVLLPIFIFMRSFSLYFVQQVTLDWQIFTFENRCPACGYDLRGNPTASTCPECGRDVPPPAMRPDVHDGPARFAPPSPPMPPGGPFR